MGRYEAGHGRFARVILTGEDARRGDEQEAPAPSDPHPGQTEDPPVVPGSGASGDPLKEAK